MQKTPVRFVLWEANVRAHPYRQKVAAARAGGFHVLTMPARIYTHELETGSSDADILAIARDAGVTLDFLDGMSSWAPIRFPATVEEWIRKAFDYSVEESLKICDVLGLKHILAVGAFDKGAVEMPQLIDAFGRFCEQAGRYGVWVDLEPMPMLGIPNLEMAWEIIGKVGAKNSGIMLDTWHFMRAGADFPLLRSLPAGVISDVQVVDATTTARCGDLWKEAAHYRMFPGEGELPLLEILGIIHAKGGIRSVGPEIFSDEADAMTPKDCGERSARTTSAVLVKVGFMVAS